MLQDGWQALFAPHILQRGKDYRQQGRVEKHSGARIFRAAAGIL